MADPREVVLELIAGRVSPASPWAGRRHLKSWARENDWPIDVDAGEFDEAYYALRDDVETVTWHGLTTLNDDELLTAAAEAEANAEFTRRPLLARLNRAKAGTYEPPSARAVREQEGLPPEEGP